ncbi:MAG: hypothetical protein HPY66_0537 [Firmicutes bacterium]|nr:hypothetical protein [Bacillota bacterium]MDI6704910.1 DUF4846 domain-containing protein [Bacillota bacterium]
MGNAKLVASALAVLMLGVLIPASCAINHSDTEKGPITIGDVDDASRETYDGLIDQEGNTVETRIIVPKGFERVAVEEGSFGEYLRNLPLKPHGSKVLYFDGRVKHNDVYEAVVDMDVGDRDLQQCADAVMRLRAEYLYKRQRYDEIHFNFTNGFRADYSKWMQGNRIAINGNSTSWVQRAERSNTYSDFRSYLNIVFAYAGTLSLEKELKPIEPEQLMIGDVIIQGGSPGHAVIVVDMAEDKDTGKRVFMLAQSYMPAQEIHILKNPVNKEISPWYELDFADKLYTPEWTFTRDSFRRFP